MNLGQLSELMIDVEDPEDEFSLTVQGGLPENSVLEALSEGEFIFQWTLQEITFMPLVFVANDSQGASTLFTPVVEICACENGGNCTRDGLLTNNATIVLICQCTEGILINLALLHYIYYATCIHNYVNCESQSFIAIMCMHSYP